jgi:hypothetical protein
MHASSFSCTQELHKPSKWPLVLLSFRRYPVRSLMETQTILTDPFFPLPLMLFHLFRVVSVIIIPRIQFKSFQINHSLIVAQFAFIHTTSARAELHFTAQWTPKPGARYTWTLFCNNNNNNLLILLRYNSGRAVFPNRRAAARYRALASIIPGRER